jgi:hypothetical protein
MNKEKRMKLINDIFSPKSKEKVLVIYDIPHGKIKDNEKWKEKREIAND